MPAGEGRRDFRVAVELGDLIEHPRLCVAVVWFSAFVEVHSCPPVAENETDASSKITIARRCIHGIERVPCSRLCRASLPSVCLVRHFRWIAVFVILPVPIHPSLDGAQFFWSVHRTRSPQSNSSHQTSPLSP